MSAPTLPPGIALDRLAGPVPAWRAGIRDGALWRAGCAAVSVSGGRLASLWATDLRDRGDGYRVSALCVTFEGLVCLDLDLPAAEPAYPDLSDMFPCALRMQRAARDLVGTTAIAQHGGSPDDRNWLRHGAWPDDVYPLRNDSPADTAWPMRDDPYRFVLVEGDGVHEIPVGPVHAGTIEPGHFRFSVVGERVLRLEERLGYKHKGVEKRFRGLGIEDGARLAGRISGDSTVAHAWAFAMAVEAARGVIAPPRAQYLRALFLERERIANHLGDLGALGNDGGLAFGLSQFLRLKEDLLRTHQDLFGHRLLMDSIVPGGVACELDAHGVDRLLGELDRLQAELRRLRVIYYDHPGLQDRCIACGVLAPATAARLGVTGVAARASGLAIDARVHPGLPPYPELHLEIATHRNGDVASRIVVRFDELFESIRILRRILRRLPDGEARTDTGASCGGYGLGWIEGWRGEVLMSVDLGPDGRIHRCHPHDPSWQIWPALEYAILGNIVPDFPLINKSFNLSYAGHDL